MTTKTNKIEYKNTMGLAAMQGRGFYYPFDLAFDNSEKFYVLGRGHDGDPRGCRIVVMDMNEEYYGTFGSHGTENGQFVWPSSIAVNSRDNLYISDEASNKITIMSKDGMFRYIMIENIRFIMIIIREKGFLLIHQKVFSYGIHSQKLMIFIRIGHYKLKNILIKMIQIM